MKIIWHSNAPFVPTGYGNQTALFTPLLRAEGYEVIQSAYYGHHGAPLKVGGVSVRSGSLDGWGNDILPYHRMKQQPDLMIGLHDVFVMQQATVDAVGDIYAAWCPVDRVPLPRMVERRLKHLRWKLAMSKHGEQMMKDAGMDDVIYIPHGIDTKTYHPVEDREALRKHLGWDGKFVMMMNAANKVLRKNMHVVLKAFADFVKEYPESRLYLHTYPFEHMNGLNLPECADFYGLTVHEPYGNAPRHEAQVLFPDFYRYQQSLISMAELNQYYNGADVLLSPSRGEGFGIPVVEAQAAGCPVVVTDFTAQTELCGAGKLIKPAWLEYTDQGAEVAMVAPDSILEAMKWAYEQRHDAKLRQRPRDFALPYDFIEVFKTYWKPALDVMLERPRTQQRRTEQRLALRQATPKEVVKDVA